MLDFLLKIIAKNLVDSIKVPNFAVLFGRDLAKPLVESPWEAKW